LLSFSLDLFHSKRTDILAPRNLSVPTYTGLSLPDENIGIVINRGIEAQLTHRSRPSGDFSYYITGNFTFARNKVDYLDEAADLPDYQRREGFPIDSWVLYEADGIFQTQEEVDAYPTIIGTGPGDVKLVDIDGDDEITSLDQVRRNYSITPEIMYGINLGFNYKGLNLSVLLQGQANALLVVKPYRLNFDKVFFDERWQQQGDNKYPRTFTDHTQQSGQSSYNSTFWLKSASFLRLKNVFLSYKLPHNWIQPVRLSGVEIYVSGFNLFTIDQIKIFDPELDSNDGIDYPLQRIIQTGIRLNF
jgi:hypothetical protein